MHMRVLSVGEVTAYLKDLIEVDPILGDLWVRGEVSNLSRSAAGHMYFCLVSEGIQINCVLFRGNQMGILAFPRNGEEVLAHGRITIYESRGQYQLMVDNVAPVGMGIMQLQFEEIKRRLSAEGLFADERKRPLPAIPTAIGVVTSAQGAVWHDIQTVVARRFALTHLLLAPSAVQGPNAPDELIRGLQALQEDGRADVIIIGRGGGAAEDLAAFNDERLARAIFGSSIPVVSAVGHETDTCIADLVADMRAATPSAAAELCVPNKDDIMATVGHIVSRSRAVATDTARQNRNQLVEVSATIRRTSPQERINRSRQDLDVLTSSVQQQVSDALGAHRQALMSCTATAALLDPRDILRRGYAIVTSVDGGEEVRLARAEAANLAGAVRITFSDGSVKAQVIQGAR
jgi:exodeoxyribonuclease VII large subunit